MADTKTQEEGAKSAAVLAAFAGKDDIEVLRSGLAHLGREAAVLAVGGPKEAADWCSKNPVPGLLIVDLSHSDFPVAELSELGLAAGPGTRIVALGSDDSTDLYRSLLKAGAFDYLVSPLTESRVADLISRSEGDEWLGLPGAESVRVGETIAITGVSGGVGTSSLAALLGLAFAEELKLETVLVDYDRRKGDLALLLGLKADNGLSGVLSAAEIDYRLIERTLIAKPAAEKNEKPRLKLLGQRPGAETPVAPEELLQVGGMLCELFPASIWDIPSHRPAGSIELLTHADVSAIVLDFTVENIRAAKILLAELGTPQPGQRRFLIANHSRSARKSLLTKEQVEGFLGEKIALELPYAEGALQASVLEGALSAEKAPELKRAVSSLAALLLGRPEMKTASSGLLSGLLSRFSRM